MNRHRSGLKERFAELPILEKLSTIDDGDPRPYLIGAIFSGCPSRSGEVHHTLGAVDDVPPNHDNRPTAPSAPYFIKFVASS